LIDYAKGLPDKMYDAALKMAKQFWEGFKKGLDKRSPSLPERALMDIANQARLTALSVIDAGKDIAGGMKPLESLYGGSSGYTMSASQVVTHRVEFGSLPPGIQLEFTARDVADMLNKDSVAAKGVARIVLREQGKDTR
jgi:hypothetical protein